MADKTAIIISGYFSPLHTGHLDMIEDARSRGDAVLVIKAKKLRIRSLTSALRRLRFPALA